MQKHNLPAHTPDCRLGRCPLTEESGIRVPFLSELVGLIRLALQLRCSSLFRERLYALEKVLRNFDSKLDILSLWKILVNLGSPWVQKRSRELGRKLE
jgi:hypothetical protein